VLLEQHADGVRLAQLHHHNLPHLHHHRLTTLAGTATPPCRLAHSKVIVTEFHQGETMGIHVEQLQELPEDRSVYLDASILGCCGFNSIVTCPVCTLTCNFC
jgi:hypothetical protein